MDEDEVEDVKNFSTEVIPFSSEFEATLYRNSLELETSL